MDDSPHLPTMEESERRNERSGQAVTDLSQEFSDVVCETSFLSRITASTLPSQLMQKQLTEARQAIVSSMPASKYRWMIV